MKNERRSSDEEPLSSPLLSGSLNDLEIHRSFSVSSGLERPKAMDQLTIGSVLKNQYGFYLTTAFTRLLYATRFLGQTLWINYFLAKKNSNLIAATPMAMMISQGLSALCGSFLMATIIVVGKLTGEIKLGHAQAKQVGAATNQGLLLALIVSIPQGLIFFFSESILNSLNLDSELTALAGSFLRASSYSLIFLHWCFLDSIVLLSLGKVGLATALIAILTVLTLGCGMLWTYFSEQWDGIAYGLGVATVFTFFIGRLIMLLNKDLGKRYSFFTCSFNSGTTFKEFVALGVPNALQGFSKFLPGALISICISALQYSKEISAALEPSMMISSVVSLLLLSQAVTAKKLISEAIGEGRSQKETKTIGCANILPGLFFSILVAVVCFIYPQGFISMCLGNLTLSEKILMTNETSASYSQQSLSQAAMRVAGSIFVVQSVQITTTANILGRKNVPESFMSALSNLLVITVLSSLLGYLLQVSLGPISYLIVNMVAIFMMSIANYTWWRCTKDNISAYEMPCGLCRKHAPQATEEVAVLASTS